MAFMAISFGCSRRDFAHPGLRIELSRIDIDVAQTGAGMTGRFG
jgi:hypothetical protein